MRAYEKPEEAKIRVTASETAKSKPKSSLIQIKPNQNQAKSSRSQNPTEFLGNRRKSKDILGNQQKSLKARNVEFTFVDKGTSPTEPPPPAETPIPSPERAREAMLGGLRGHSLNYFISNLQGRSKLRFPLWF